MSRGTALVLHVGDCKAGSTAIQSVLRAGSYRVSGPRPLYPEAGRRGRLNHHALADCLHLPGPMRWRDRAWSRLGAELEDSAAGAAIVSSERFEFTPPEALAEMLARHVPWAQPRVILYVRPHAERLLSGYAQNVKQGLFTGDLDAFAAWAAEGRLIYAPRLARWRAVFGAALTVRPMIRPRLAGGSVVVDMLRFASGCDDVKVLSVPQANRAPDAVTVEALRKLWQGIAEKPAAGAMEAQKLRALVAALEEEWHCDRPPLAVYPALAARLPGLFGADAAACDRAVFGVPVLGLALQLASEGGGAPSRTAVPERVAEDAARLVEVFRGHLAGKGPLPPVTMEADPLGWSSAR